MSEREGCEVETERGRDDAGEQPPWPDVDGEEVLNHIYDDADRILDDGDPDACYHARQIQQAVVILREGLDR